MDQQHDLLSLLDHLRTIISTQNLPNTSTSKSETKQRILPSTVPALPSQLLTLPSGGSLPSLTSTTQPSSLTSLTTLLQTHILPHLSLSSLSPNYYGFITGGATPAALLADFLVSIYDQNVAVHLPAESIATDLEVAALNLLVQLFKLPGEEWGIGTSGQGGGTITTGATASNVLGLGCGREWVIREAGRRMGHASADVSVGQQGLLEACLQTGIKSVQVLSSLPHSSVVKAAAVVGIGRDSVISIGTEDDALSIDIHKLESLARNMRAEGKAYVLAVSAGEVNTGRFATDGAATMKRVRQICDEHGIWMHVDGAFGLFGRVLMHHDGSDEYEDVIRGVEGIELADSITGDGHKLLNVPYDCGLFFTRHKDISERVFSNGGAAYLTSGIVNGAEGPQVQSPLNIGIENSRRFRALPVWATLMAYGRHGYVDMLRRQVGLARRVVEWMWDVEGLEVLPKCTSKEEAVRRTFMVALFRARDEAVNRDLVKRINGTGRMYVTGTSWDGAPAVRIAVSNWQVDVERDSALIKGVLGGCL